MRSLARRIAIAVAVIFVAACGRTPSSSAPTAPSVSSPSAPSGSATISGTATTTAGATSVRATGTTGLTVSIVGTALSAVVDGNGGFTIANVPPLEVVLKFEGPGINASVSLGTVAPMEQIHVAVTVTGTTATLDSQQRTGTDNSIQAEGHIDDLDATPRRFLMSGVIVDASGATIRRADGTAMTFDDLRRGDRVKVRGTREGTTIRAAEVIDQNSAAPPVTMSGTIVAVAGSCPSVTLTLSGATNMSLGTRNMTVNVSTRPTTTFARKACAEIRSGDLATIVAERQADDSLVATSVDAKTPPAVTVTFSGTVGSVSGSCPTLTLGMSGASGLSMGPHMYSATVTTNASTAFPTNACSAIKSGDTATIAATKQGDGSYLASKVDAKAQTTWTISGTITSLSGSCPGVTLVVAGITVVANSSTVWSSESCSVTKVGDVATVVKTVNPAGGYLAVSVDAKPPSPVTFTGTIGSVSGACPSLTLALTSVSGLSSLSVSPLTYTATVITNANTSFPSLACTSIVAGKTASISATRQNDGSYLASKADVK